MNFYTIKKTIIIHLLLLLPPTMLFSQVENNISQQDKLYGLSLIWREATYNFAYFDKIGINKWDSIYFDAIERVKETDNDYLYYRELQRFIAQLQDGHTAITYFPKYINRWTTIFENYKIELSYVENKIVVSRVNYSKKDELPIGSELIEINGINSHEYLEKGVLPYISASTDYVRYEFAAYSILEGLKGVKYKVKFKTPKGKILSMELIHKRLEERKVYPEYPDNKEFEFKWLEHKIAYIAINNFSDSSMVETFKSYLGELYKAKGLIIDIRYNYGGKTKVGLDIFKYLTNDENIFGERLSSRKNIASYFVDGKYIAIADTFNSAYDKEAYLGYRFKLFENFDYEPFYNDCKAKKITIPTVILIGHNTASAAEDFLVFARQQKHITLIGEKTFGSTGSSIQIKLPKGGKARICVLRSLYPDGTEFVGKGISPDVEVKRTIKSLIENGDKVLLKAENILKNNGL